MSNYHVEAADKSQALTSEALKSLRHQQVQGLSRRQLIRRSLGAGVALWLLEISAGTIGFIWPNLASGFGGKLPIGTFDDVKTANSTLPIEEGFPAYFAEARAFVILIDPAQQRFIPGEDTTGDGSALNLLEISAGTIGFIWPNLASGFGGKLPIGTFDDVKTANSTLPIEEGFPAYFAEARAFVILIDPAQQRFIPGEDTTGDGSALNVR